MGQLETGLAALAAEALVLVRKTIPLAQRTLLKSDGSSSDMQTGGGVTMLHVTPPSFRA